MSLSFTKEFYPHLDELTPKQFSDAREEAATTLLPVMAGIDMAPATPTGDFVVTPLSAHRAAAEEANRRFMSDLDLSNVANGVIYSCDFVRAYLGNFGVYDTDNIAGSGLVRLTFSSPDAREIPFTSRFRFGTSDDWSLRVTNPDAAAGATFINVLAAGSSHNGAGDTYVLAQTTVNTWAVDLPVTGVLSSPIARGATGTGTEVSADLVGIAAATDFTSGQPSASLAGLARTARKIAHTLTAGSRSSTRSLVYRNWPEANMVSPILPGDAEMQRIAAGSAMALQAPAVDLFLRSSHDLQRISQNIRLNYVPIPAAGPEDPTHAFRGVMPLLHCPSRIISIEWSGTTETSRVVDYQVFSESTKADLHGSLHCGTRYEKFYAQVLPVMVGGVPDFPRFDDDDGTYAIFTVVYDCDPLLETVSSLLESPDYKPPGVEVLVKSGPLMLLDELVITYVKRQGVRTTLSAARDKIVEYLRTAGYPDDFRVTKIYDIVRNAGADKVISVSAYGTISVSAAGRRLRDGITDPDWWVNSDDYQVLPFDNVEELASPDSIVTGPISVGGPADAWAATNRTVRYAIDPQNVKFIETS